jgi:2-amino-4-hydroxy-6-hydroxymethyldihydropteridine diphosphokinase
VQLISNTPEDLPGFEAFLLIGTNIGQRAENIDKALRKIEKVVGDILGTSSIYESAAWGNENQDHFLNMVVKVETQLGPWELLEQILDIEKDMGRVRKEKWGERLIDIDILYFDEVVANSFDLEIPHPGIPERRFTLEPLKEIAPEKIHPKLKKTQQQLLEECPDQLWVKKWQSAD